MGPTEDATDEELVRSIADRDEEALALLYRRRYGAVHRFALLVSGSAAAADEIAQETFLQLIDRARTYDPARGGAVAFLFGIARNRVRRWRSRVRTYEPLEGASTDLAALAAPFPHPVDEMARRESLESLRRAVAALPPRYREVVVLCDLEELSYADAGTALGCAIGTVRSRLHRAHALLIHKLRGAARSAPSRSTLRATRWAS